MSNATVGNISFVTVLSAAVNKAEQPALIVEAIRAAAEAFASNGGAKNKVQYVKDVCVTTPSGKPRTPAVGTMPAPERTRRGSPANSRNFLSEALTAGWYMPSRMAAFDTLRSVSTVCRTLMR